MTLYSGIEASPSEIIGKGIVLLRVNKEFDYEKQTFVDLVVIYFIYFHEFRMYLFAIILSIRDMILLKYYL